MFLMLYSINYILLTDQISLSGYLYFLRYWSICILQFFGNQAVTSYILRLTLIFLINPSFYMTKKWRKKVKYIEKENSFSGKIKSIFHHFNTFWSCWEMDCWENLRLISKFITSQTGKQMVATRILPNISKSKEMFSFKNHAENETKRLVTDLFLFFEKALHKVKASGQHLRYHILVDLHLDVHFWTVDPEICSILIFL